MTLPTPGSLASSQMLRISIWAQHASHSDATNAWGEFRTLFFGSAIVAGYQVANSDTANTLSLIYTGSGLTLKNNLSVPLTVRVIIE